jgi:2-methylisocitrate lyase-like PEP mutase family enzyme
MPQPSLTAKAERLRALHVPGRPLVLPNAWDAGTARIIAAEGFPVIATTSAGVAFSYGYPDGEAIPRADMLHAVRRIAAAVSVPVTADVEAGYGPEPNHVAITVMELLGAGVAGANFEDSSEAQGGALFELDLASARIGAARKAAEDAGIPFVVNARTDALLRIRDPEAAFAEAVKRLNAYRAAGADCLFAPFTADPAVIGRLVKALDGPLNIILQPTITVAEMAALGVARISLGGHLARAALGAARRAARELKEHGTCAFAREAIDHRELNRLMAARD